MTGREQPGSLEGRLAAALERIGNAVRGLRVDVAYRHGLTATQFSLLESLAAAPAARRRVGILAAQHAVTAPTASDAVAALRRKGLVTGGPVLAVTDAGRAVLDAVDGWDGPIVDVLRALPADGAAATLAVLFEVIAGLQAAGLVSVGRVCNTCRFFDPAEGQARCNLLGVPLPPEALRIDCPEHERAA